MEMKKKKQVIRVAWYAGAEEVPRYSRVLEPFALFYYVNRDGFLT